MLFDWEFITQGGEDTTFPRAGAYPWAHIIASVAFEMTTPLQAVAVQFLTRPSGTGSHLIVYLGMIRQHAAIFAPARGPRYTNSNEI